MSSRIQLIASGSTLAGQGKWGNACRDRQGHEWRAKPEFPGIDMLAMETACVISVRISSTTNDRQPTIESLERESVDPNDCANGDLLLSHPACEPGAQSQL